MFETRTRGETSTTGVLGNTPRCSQAGRARTRSRVTLLESVKCAVGVTATATVLRAGV